jgi:alkyl sulfatase BDS1-like metallo-beta-lactamase superfamily hydrolase
VSTLEHGALTWIVGKTAPDAGAMVTTTRPAFESVVLGQRKLADAVRQGDITTLGIPKAISDLFALLVEFDPRFPIIEHSPHFSQTHS